MTHLYANESGSRPLLVQNSAWTRFVHLAAKGLEALADGFITWQRRHRDRMHLMALDDRLLHDIGVSLADVEREVSKPFWKP